MRKFRNVLAGRKDKHDKKTEKETPPYRTGHLFGPGPSVSDRRGQSESWGTWPPVPSPPPFSRPAMTSQDLPMPFPSVSPQRSSPMPAFQAPNPPLATPVTGLRPPVARNPVPGRTSSSEQRASFSGLDSKPLPPIGTRVCSEGERALPPRVGVAEVKRTTNTDVQPPTDSSAAPTGGTKPVARPRLSDVAGSGFHTRREAGAAPTAKASEKSSIASKGPEKPSDDSDTASTVSIGKDESPDSDSDLDIGDLLAFIMTERYVSARLGRDSPDIDMEAMLLAAMLSREAEGGRASSSGDRKPSADKKGSSASSSRPILPKPRPRDKPGAVSQSGVKTALHWAAQRGQAERCLSLLSRGIDVDCRDKNGETPLHFATWYGSLAATRVLVEHGADINAASHAFPSGTPLRWAREQKHSNIVEYLVKQGAIEAGPSPNTSTPSAEKSSQPEVKKPTWPPPSSGPKFKMPVLADQKGVTASRPPPALPAQTGAAVSSPPPEPARSLAEPPPLTAKKPDGPAPGSTSKFKVPLLAAQTGVTSSPPSLGTPATTPEKSPSSRSPRGTPPQFGARRQLRGRRRDSDEFGSLWDSTTPVGPQTTTRTTGWRMSSAGRPPQNVPERDLSPTPSSIAEARRLHEKRVAGFQAAAAIARQQEAPARNRPLPPPAWNNPMISRRPEAAARQREAPARDGPLPPPAWNNPMFSGRPKAAQPAQPQKEPARQAPGPKFKVPVLGKE